VNEDQGNRGQQQERPLRNSTDWNQQVGAIANRTFDFSFLNYLNAILLRILAHRDRRQESALRNLA